MNIGNKVKQLRIAAGLTQNQLAGDKITRNMLSCIESGKASPSIETLNYLAEGLNVPISFLVSEDDDLFFYQKNELIKKIKTLFIENKYSQCIDTINKCAKLDDELSYILCKCYFQLGKDAVLNGSLNTGKSMLENCFKYSLRTIYDTALTEALASMYYSLTNNIQSPLLDFDSAKVEKALSDTADLDLFYYIVQNPHHKYNNDIFLRHLKVKEMIQNRRYYEAISELSKIEDEKGCIRYNAYFIFSLYSDMEICYRQLGDFENAYRYASKRLALLDAFNS